MSADPKILKRRVRILLIIFIVGLVFSGLTAFPIKQEVDFLQRFIGEGTDRGADWPLLARWISTIHRAVSDTHEKHPLMFYGTDWLAFAHLVIAIAFFGPLRDPVKNIWVVEFGMIACVLVIPLALICGPIRGIPFFWQLIDCSFGVIGLLPLWLAWRIIRRMSQLEDSGVRAQS
jgi:hypothetical protein